MSTNPHEDLARLKKAHKLADFVTHHRFNLSDLQAADEQWWKACAHMAGVNTPSVHTVALVLHILSERERGFDPERVERERATKVREQMQDDPFEGLPKPRQWAS